jgi:hypothetical protein
MNRFTAVANTNENGLTYGKEYIVKSNYNGTVDVYDMIGNYLMIHRTDSFDNWHKIE